MHVENIQQKNHPRTARITEDASRRRDLEVILKAHREQKTKDLQVMLDRIRSKNESESQGVIDAHEVASNIAIGDPDFRLLDQTNATLQGIDRALLRLSRGNYGLCVDCKDEIPLNRLEAIPFAERCVVCERRRTRRQG